MRRPHLLILLLGLQAVCPALAHLSAGESPLVRWYLRACDLATWKVEVGGSGVCHLLLHSQFKASLIHMRLSQRTGRLLLWSLLGCLGS